MCSFTDRARTSGIGLALLLFSASQHDPGRAGAAAKTPGPGLAPQPESADTLYYSLRIDTTLFETLHAEIRVEEVNRRRLLFSMPVWMPGAYRREPFAERVHNVSARDHAGRALRSEPLSPDLWEVGLREPGTVLFGYDISADHYGPMGTTLDSSGVLVQGASTWMSVRGLERSPVQLTVQIPDPWRAATALSPAASRSMNPRSKTWSAAGYDELVDSPVLLGQFRDTLFTSGGAAHELYVHGEAGPDRPPLADLPALTAMVEKIVRYPIALFGGIPCDRYLFFYLLSSGNPGARGLEHACSSTIELPAYRIAGDVTSAAEITAHEYFHLWNVKRITSDQLLPLRYDQEPRFDSLWWLEGVTSYYASLTLRRTGVWTVEQFLGHMEREIERLLQTPDRKKTSLARASREVWERGYWGPGLSYYNKGELVGWMLDVTIRKITGNTRSLDDVMRFLYSEYAQSGRGFADNDLVRAVETVTGVDFTPFFDRYIDGVVEIPFQELLDHAGLGIRIEREHVPALGRLRTLGERGRIFTIDAESAAYRAGLRRGDRLVALDGESATDGRTLARAAAEKRIGQQVRIAVVRDGVDMVFDATLEGEEVVDCQITLTPQAGEQQLALRSDLLLGEP